MSGPTSIIYRLIAIFSKDRCASRPLTFENLDVQYNDWRWKLWHHLNVCLNMLSTGVLEVCKSWNVSFRIDPTTQSLQEIMLNWPRLIRVFEGHRTYFQTEVANRRAYTKYCYISSLWCQKITIILCCLKIFETACRALFLQWILAFFDSSSLTYNVNLNLGKVGKLWDSTFLD